MLLGNANNNEQVLPTNCMLISLTLGATSPRHAPTFRRQVFVSTGLSNERKSLKTNKEIILPSSSVHHLFCYISTLRIR